MTDTAIPADFVRRAQQHIWSRLSEDEKQRRLERAWREVHVPRRFHEVSFDTFNPATHPGLDEEAYALARMLSEEGSIGERRGILMLGHPGNGKTSLGACILRAFTERHQGREGARFWNVPQGLIAIQQEFGHNGERSATTITDLAAYPMLMLDDLGKHKWTEWTQAQFYALLDEAWSEEKGLVITTNLEEAAFMGMDDALISRILGTCHMVRVQGADHRLPQE